MMQKAMDLIRNLEPGSFGKTARNLVCVQTGEVATTIDWAKAISELRSIKYASAYGLIMRSLHKRIPLYGLTFEYTDANVEEEDMQPQLQLPVPPAPRQPQQQGVFHRRHVPAPQPVLTSHETRRK